MGAITVSAGTWSERNECEGEYSRIFIPVSFIISLESFVTKSHYRRIQPFWISHRLHEILCNYLHARVPAISSVSQLEALSFEAT